MSLRLQSRAYYQTNKPFKDSQERLLETRNALHRCRLDYYVAMEAAVEIKGIPYVQADFAAGIKTRNNRPV